MLQAELLNYARNLFSSMHFAPFKFTSSTAVPFKSGDYRPSRDWNAICENILRMYEEPVTTHSENSESSIKEKFEPVSKKASESYDCVTERIRQNPVSSVIGAAVFGAAVCYLILEGRHHQTLRERYVTGPLSDAGDNVSTSVRTAYDNLKFW